MGLNFRKSIKILPGVKLNLSKSGVGLSTGVKGARVSLNSKGQARTTLGIPGTGIYYTKQVSAKKIAKEAKEKFTGKKADKKGSAETAAAAVTAKNTKKGLDEETIAANAASVAEYAEYVESIKSVHKQSDGAIDWVALKNNEVPSNIVKGSDEHKAWTELAEYADSVIEGDVDTYLEIVGKMGPFEDLSEYGSNFQIGTDRSDYLEVEFGVMSDEVVPKVEISQKANGEISEKDLSKTAYFDLVQDYVASTTIRIARDAFALLPVDTVVVHAVDMVLNTATGYEEETTLLSVKFDRSRVMSLNMAMIDPSDALGGFEHNMKFKKTEGFQPVSRIEA